jgi:hypothetical protein
MTGLPQFFYLSRLHYGLPRNSCRANFTINNDNNNKVNAFVDDKLVLVSVDAAELTNIVGDDITPFFADTK